MEVFAELEQRMPRLISSLRQAQIQSAPLALRQLVIGQANPYDS